MRIEYELFPPRRGFAQRFRGARRERRKPARGHFRPVIDVMEDRTLLSTLTVTNNRDHGLGSLRAAIAAAASGDKIKFARQLDGETIVLTTGELVITKNLDIEGPGADNLTISGGGSSRIFDVTTSGLNVTVAGLTLAAGEAS